MYGHMARWGEHIMMFPALSDTVVPAQAGTHTPCPHDRALMDSIVTFGIMSPRLRGDDKRDSLAMRRN
jgi:hypothetical protein